MFLSENETILINLIRQHKNPDDALLTAIQIILLSLNQEKSVSNSLKQPESSEEPFSVFLQELA